MSVLFDYRNNLKRILNQTAGDDRSLQNGLTAIKAIIGMADSGSAETESQPKVRNHNLALDDITQNQIKMLLNSLTTLIESPGDQQAKTNALKALHKLTFTAGIGKTFGKNLGKLDQEIQKSETTQTSVNKKLFEQALAPKKEIKKDYRKGKRYTVIRALTGAELINDNGEVVYNVDEAHIHSLNLKSGDIVEALPLNNGSLNMAEVLRVVGYRKLRSRDYDQIDEFKYAVVQGSPGNLSVAHNSKGEKLRINHKPVIVAIDSSFYQNGQTELTDGSIVDLAWYRGDVRLKKDPAQAVKIRWIYETQQPQRVGKHQKKAGESQNSPQELAKLDLNLHYQRVGVAIGDNQNENVLEGIVSRYNGIPIAINAFEGKKKVIENQLKDLDIVILVTAFAAHDSTWNIREFASKYGVKFAVSSSKGYQAFERALYRAANGLPAYEGNQTIEYKIANNTK